MSGMNTNTTDEKAYRILRLKARLETNIGILDSEGDIRRLDGLMVSERIRDLQNALVELEGGDESRQEAEDYNDRENNYGYSLRDEGRNDDGSGESYAERNA
jgi:hypothetical protein